MFAVLDDAIFYIKEDDDDLQVKLPSIQAGAGYREAIPVDLDEIEMDAEDITVLYVMRVGASYIYISCSLLLVSSLFYLL